MFLHLCSSVSRPVLLIVAASLLHALCECFRSLTITFRRQCLIGLVLLNSDATLFMDNMIFPHATHSSAF